MKGGQRRDAIIERAIELFSEKGFRGTTTRHLAESVGVTEPVLYQHFRNKGELYDAILETKAAEGQQRFESVLGPYLEGSDDEAFFCRLAELILEKHDRDPGYIRLLLFSALERHELAELVYERQVVTLYDLVARYLKRRMNEGGIRTMDPKLAARVFLGTVSHHGLTQILFGERILKASRKQLIAGMVSVFLQGMAAR